MEDTTQRLDKYLANLGVTSRRTVEELLHSKTLTVNGKRVTQPGTRINPQKDKIVLIGVTLEPPKRVYYLVHKPKGVISTSSDEKGRKNVISLVPSKQRLYPVGRLDKETTGLIILTNDGELTNLLTHPRYHVSKVYRLIVQGTISRNQIRAFQRGINLTDGKTAPAEIHIVNERRTTSLLQITLHEGKNRQIRRMCEKVGLPLLELSRIKIGPIEMGNLTEGSYRMLSKKEIQQLKDAALSPA